MAISDTSGQDVIMTPKRSKKMWIVTMIVLLLFILAAVFVAPSFSRWSQADHAVSMQSIVTAKVKRGDLIRDVSVIGRVIAAVRPRLYSTGQGTITFSVAVGDKVKKGDILAVIDSHELSNELKQEESNLERLKMDYESQRIQSKMQALNDQRAVDVANIRLIAADREKRRADKAYETKAISQIDFEEAQDDLANAKLDHKHAIKDAALNIENQTFEVNSRKLQVDRQTLLVAELQRKVEQLVVRSPIDGIVGNLEVEQKNQVTQNQTIMTVVDLSKFELELAIPESYADDLALDMEAEVYLNGETFFANLVAISPEITNNMVTGQLRFDPSKGGQPAGLRQNQRLTTRILLEEKRDVKLVQRGRFLDSYNGTVAYVVEDGVAKRQRILVGARSLGEVEVISGLQEGDEIIVSSTSQFQDNYKILITN